MAFHTSSCIALVWNVLDSLNKNQSKHEQICRLFLVSLLVPSYLNPESRTLTGRFGLTFPDAEGHGDDPVGAGDAVQAADEVWQVVQHAQVVLHHDDVPEAQSY